MLLIDSFLKVIILETKKTRRMKMKSFLKVLLISAAIIFFSLFGARALASEVETVEISFYIGSTFVKTEEVGKDMPINTDGINAPFGYEIIGWSKEEGGEHFDIKNGSSDDIALYADVRLKSPEFSLSSLSFVYDGEARVLSPLGLTHPLSEKGVFSFEWYKNGNLFSKQKEISLKNVSDSGEYSLKVMFSVNGECREVMSPAAEVKISPKTVKIPMIADKEYNGREQKADIMGNSLYTVEAGGGIYVGEYPVKIKLTDPYNHVFEGGKSEIDADFRILKAENKFLSALTAYDIYENQQISVFASALHGEVKYLYSNSPSGEFKSDLPSKSGKYYVKAIVEGNENYSSLQSEIKEFSIISESAVNVSIAQMPHKTVYQSFDTFVPDGLVLKVVYNSGATSYINAEQVKISYKEGEFLRFGHTSVFAEYLGFKTEIQVTVEKREYDISAVTVANAEKTYNGERQSIDFYGVLPVGLDGIPLQYEILGFGINTGIYSCAVVFKTESCEYVAPSSIEVILKIIPYETNVVWGAQEYVYDGFEKCPDAYYLDIYGRKIRVAVEGKSVNAGLHTAVAISEDGNYRLMNSKTTYTVKKADLDLSGIYWTVDGFIYDGEEKGVYLYGIPSGVEIVGYVDNKGVNAGVYRAKAVIAFDTQNYNYPPEIVYVWSIEKSDYDISSFSFFDAVYTYDALEHYPRFEGVMPIGKDGVPLGFVFGKGVSQVNEGKSEVEVTFTTESVNYRVPETITRTVEIVPFGINILWQNSDFVYDGSEKIPSVSDAICEFQVDGGAVNAGVYTAVCHSLNANYFIINSEFRYEIKKAENAFKSHICISDIYEGQDPQPSAEVLAGDVVFRYFDSQMVLLDEPPFKEGEYYVKAYSSGNENYNEIISDAVKFKIIRVVPVSFFVTLADENLKAFDTLSLNDFRAFFKNNDGSITEISTASVSVFYQNGDSLRAKDTLVTFACAGFSNEIEISVSKANYDMTSVKWTTREFEFDGTEKRVILEGLPSGVSVLSYQGNSAIGAGEYSVFVNLKYDTENYNPPKIPECTLVINKCLVQLPKIESVTYNGNPIIPKVEESELYEVTVSENTNAGRYFAILTLKDPQNYTFGTEGGTAFAEYRILPITLSVTVSDAERYLFEKMPTFENEIISGDILEGDEVSVKFRVENGLIYCESENPNYNMIVTPGRLTEYNRPSNRFFIVMFIIFLWLISFLFFLLFYLRKRKNAVLEGAQIIEVNSSGKEVPFENILEVTPERADVLITDSLAKNLLRKGGYTVYTKGSKKGIINVDVLGENFEAGADIDINALKEKGLLAADMGYFKVLARGVLNKSLKVKANNFSLSAVKMIALTGGEAVRVSTHRAKKNK